MSMSASTVRTSLANVMSNSTCTQMQSHAVTCTHMHSHTCTQRGHQRGHQRGDQGGDQRRSEAISINQHQSVAISSHQQPSAAISSPQHYSAAIISNHPHLAMHDHPFGCGKVAGEQTTVAPY